MQTFEKLPEFSVHHPTEAFLVDPQKTDPSKHFDDSLTRNVLPELLIKAILDSSYHSHNPILYSKYRYICSIICVKINSGAFSNYVQIYSILVGRYCAAIIASFFQLFPQLGLL